MTPTCVLEAAVVDQTCGRFARGRGAWRCRTPAAWLADLSSNSRRNGDHMSLAKLSDAAVRWLLPRTTAAACRPPDPCDSCANPVRVCYKRPHEHDKVHVEGQQLFGPVRRRQKAGLLDRRPGPNLLASISRAAHRADGDPVAAGHPPGPRRRGTQGRRGHFPSRVRRRLTAQQPAAPLGTDAVA